MCVAEAPSLRSEQERPAPRVLSWVLGDVSLFYLRELTLAKKTKTCVYSNHPVLRSLAQR